MLFEQNDMKHLPINLENYEEYFLLYVDNELTEAEKKDVEVFIDQHPELRDEWTMLMDTRLSPELISMDLKNELYRFEADEEINASNMETFQLMWLDNELDEKQQHAIEEYTRKHPEAAANFELLKMAKLPVENISFPEKSSLYRGVEKPAVVISMKWQKWAVAAAILIAAGLWFINRPDEDAIPEEMVTVAQQVPKENTDSPVIENTAPGTTIDTETEESEEQNAGTRNNSATTDPSQITRLDPEPGFVQPKQVVKSAKNQAVASTEPVQIENLSRNKIDEQVTKISDPMANTPVINQTSPDMQNAKSTEVLIVKSDYATDALTQEITTIPVDQAEISDNEKPRKGMFRGIVRKANRFYNKVTNPDPERAMVKVANFEIGLPR